MTELFLPHFCKNEHAQLQIYNFTNLAQSALLRDAATRKTLMDISLSTVYNFVCLLEKCEICPYTPTTRAQVKTSKITGKISSLTRYGNLRVTTL